MSTPDWHWTKQPNAEEIRKKLSKAKSSLAFTLIHKDVLDAGDRAFIFPETFYGEDIDFLNRVEAKGHKMWVEPSVKIGHINDKVLYP